MRDHLREHGRLGVRVSHHAQVPACRSETGSTGICRSSSIDGDTGLLPPSSAAVFRGASVAAAVLLLLAGVDMGSSAECMVGVVVRSEYGLTTPVVHTRLSMVCDHDLLRGARVRPRGPAVLAAEEEAAAMILSPSGSSSFSDGVLPPASAIDLRERGLLAEARGVRAF